RTRGMPVIQITLLKGRTIEQKRKVAQRVTDAIVEEAGAKREAVTVTFVEVSREDYASGGALLADK
ncbi:MAG TPA: 2-hydroxymuconate tautomerase, partial [Terriglobales bacterium]